jgi:hypothetical protein
MSTATRQPDSAGNQPGDGGKDGKGTPVPQVPTLSFPSETRIHYTPWLLIRSFLGDTGARPLASGTVFWESPDVWVVSAAGINQPIPGQSNTVYARVSNLGRETATGVQVRFWWANPSLAITEASANLIGIGYTNIQAASTVDVQCPNPWIPVVENGGHECLLAEALIPNFDPLTAPMDPVDDRHVGQKNEQLLLVSPGHSFVVKVAAVNVFGFALPVTLQARSLVRQTTLPTLLAARTQLAGLHLTPAAAALPVTLKIAEQPTEFAAVSATFARRLLSTTLLAEQGNFTTCTSPAQITQTANLEPWEVRTAEITGRVPANATPGQTFLLRLEQSVAGIVTGGYTIQVVVSETGQ